MVNVTSFGDIAGQVSAAFENADKVTVGCACLPSGAIKSIRKSIPKNFPKWRDAKDCDVDYVVNLLLREAWAIFAVSIDKTTPQWTAFWKDADDAHAKTASLAGGSISFVKAATLIKFLLFSVSTTVASAHALKVGTMPRILDLKKYVNVQHELVFDNDIQGGENIDAFNDIWRATNAYQPLRNSLGVKQAIVSPQFTTEQAEPLLLLPDYVAGIFHAVNSQANTMLQSKVTTSAVQRAHGKLKNAVHFHEPVEDIQLNYFEIFPDFAKYSRRCAP